MMTPLSTIDQISYRGGFKYQLAQTYTCEVPIYPLTEIKTRFIKLAADGQLTIRGDYAWDGSTGVFDRNSTMIASLVHDAIYQLIRLGLLPNRYRLKADRIYRSFTIKAGGYVWLAKIDYCGLRYLAGSACLPHSERQVMLAP